MEQWKKAMERVLTSPRYWKILLSSGANKSSHTVEEIKSALMSAREGGAGKYMSAAPVLP